MSGRKILAISSFVALPLLYVFFVTIHIAQPAKTIEAWLPRWDRLLLLVSVAGLERLYTYRFAVSQRALLWRDAIANVVNLYISGAVTAFLLVPALLFGLEHTLGRKFVFASPAELGPLWIQILVILLAVSLFRYWMHRFQHHNEFLWSLHSYHHRVTDLTATNAEVSNPVDFALRNIVVFLILGVAGFDPFAILLTVSILNVTATFAHCGGDVKGGFLNYLFVTPEVHRWHHAARVPEGYGYSCNYGVEFAFWDIVFGTYYMPQENGERLQPERIGHPGGLPDEPNYLKLLLMPFGLYGTAVRALRAIGIHIDPGPQPAE
jgi:sterol desaturase/sphingolipid hydroxylase (fatty acid hydroxylase superfamily)